MEARVKRMKSKLVWTIGLLLLVPSLAFAGTQCIVGATTGPTIVPADGRVVDFDFVAPSGTNFYQFTATKGHSYSVEVRQDYDDAIINNNFTTTIFSDATCGTALAAGSATTGYKDTSGSDPALPSNSFRGSLVAGANGAYSVSVANADATTGHYVSVSVSDTTMYSGALSTFSGFATFYSFVNTTSQPITGTITAFSPAGVALGAPAAINLPAGGNVSTSTTPLGVPPGKSGYAVFTHDGPPAGVDAVSIIANFTTNFVEPISFTTVRERK